MFERFTDAARGVLVLAQEEARLLNSGRIGTEHLLLGLIRDHGPVGMILGSFDVDLSAARNRAVAATRLSGSGAPPFSPRAKKVLELSLRECLQLGHSDIGTEHLLLGLIREGEGRGVQILIDLGVDLAVLRQRITRALAEGDPAFQGVPNPLLGRRRTARARLVVCSFCGLAPPHTGQLVAGDDAFICEWCIERWSHSVRFARLGVARPDVRPPHPAPEVIPTGPPPDDIDAARAEIQAAFAGHGTTSEDGASIPSVERGDDLGPVVAMAKEKARRRGIVDGSSDVAVTVDEVQFIDAEHAAILFSITINGQPMVMHDSGDAVLINGAWKMARSTFCHIMSMGGVPCPPDKG